MNYHITNMSELGICIIPNLLVYQFITELFRHIIRYFASIFRFKNNRYKCLIACICLLMDIKQMGKFIDSCCYNLLGIQTRIY